MAKTPRNNAQRREYAEGIHSYRSYQTAGVRFPIPTQKEAIDGSPTSSTPPPGLSSSDTDSDPKNDGLESDVKKYPQKSKIGLHSIWNSWGKPVVNGLILIILSLVIVDFVRDLSAINNELKHIDGSIKEIKDDFKELRNRDVELNDKIHDNYTNIMILMTQLGLRDNTFRTGHMPISSTDSNEQSQKNNNTPLTP